MRTLQQSVIDTTNNNALIQDLSSRLSGRFQDDGTNTGTVFKFGNVFGLSSVVGSYLQRDVMSAILKQFNILMTSDEETKVVFLDAYDDFFEYSLQNTLDLEPYIETTSIKVIMEGLKNQTGTTILGFKKGSGYFSDLYEKRFDKNYGNYRLDYVDLWNKKTSETELGFQAIPLIQINYLDKTNTQQGYIVATLTADNEPNTATNSTAKAADTRSGLPSILYYQTVERPLRTGEVATDVCLSITDGTNTLNLINATTGLPMILYAGHILYNIGGVLPPRPRLYRAIADLNLGLTTEIYVGDQMPNYTNKNLVNRYFINRLWSKLSRESISAEVTINLTPDLVDDLVSYYSDGRGFGRVFTFAGRAWWLVELKDYFINTTNSATATFISWHRDFREDVQPQSSVPFTGKD